MDRIRVSVAMKNISSELSRLSVVAKGVDESIGDLIQHAGSQGLERIDVLQAVDVLAQSLDCLALVIDNIASHENLGEGISVDTLGRGVYLRDLREACITLEGDGVSGA